MNLIEAYANLDNATKKQRLDEKIPRDLANAMKNPRGGGNPSAYTINRRRQGYSDYERYPDFENNQYNEITPEEAIKLKKQGQASKVKALVNGEYVDFDNDGLVNSRSSYVRNNFGTLVKNADKVYFVDDSKANAEEKRAQRAKDNSLAYYGDTDYSWENAVRQGTIDKDTGAHISMDSYNKRRISRYQTSIDGFTQQLSDLEKQWEDGDVSRNEYSRKKSDLQKSIDVYKKEIDDIKRDNKNTAYDKRYNTDAMRMQSNITRFNDIKANPAERDVERRKIGMADEEKAYQNKITEKERKIAELQKEIDELKSKGLESSYGYKYEKAGLEAAEAKLAQQKKDLADLKAGKWSVDDMTNESLKKNGKPLKESTVYDLTPQYDSRKSFYGKARVDTDNNGKNKLYSYGTLVAEIKDGKPVVYGTFSATTLRHIKEWLQQNGFKSGTSSEIMKMYGAKNESLFKGKNRKLTESYHDNAYNIIMDSVDTIVDEVREGGDLEDAIRDEIDSHCLIYTDDIFDLARYYNVIDSSELSSNVYEPLFDDLYSRAQDKLES